MPEPLKPSNGFFARNLNAIEYRKEKAAGNGLLDRLGRVLALPMPEGRPVTAVELRRLVHRHREKEAAAIAAKQAAIAATKWAKVNAELAETIRKQDEDEAKRNMVANGNDKKPKTTSLR